MEENNERVSHPSHYTWLKGLCGIEVIDITRHMDFDLGNAVKSEECWNEMQKHQPFGVIDHIDGCTYAFARLHEKGIDFHDCFADGAPFGIKEGGEG